MKLFSSVVILLVIVITDVSARVGNVNSGADCEYTNSNSLEYPRLEKQCPMVLKRTPLYYHPERVVFKHAKYYYNVNHPNELFCDPYCGKPPRKIVEKIDYVNSDMPTHWNQTLPNTVIQTVEELRQFIRKLTSTRPTLPWCQAEDVGEGYWIPTALLSQVSQTNHNRAGRDPHIAAVAVLSLIMSGDLDVAMTWPYIWVPTKCRMFRYNITSFLQCSATWKQRTNTTLWIYIIGDSTGRGMLCELLRMLSPGGECQGAAAISPCFQGLKKGTEFMNPAHHYQLTYGCEAHHFELSFHFAFHAGCPLISSMFDKIVQVPRGDGKYGPAFLVYNSGAWDHQFRFLTKTQTHVVKSMKHIRSARLSRVKLQYAYQWEFGTPDFPIDNRQVNYRRPRIIEALLTSLSQTNLSGQLIYRSNLCNLIFEPRKADEGVENVFRRHGGKVLNLYRASSCRELDLVRDLIHADRGFMIRPPEKKRSIGELNVFVIQSLLNEICNPILLPKQ